MRRELVAAGGGLLIGAGLAWIEAFRRAELKAREKYEEQLDSHLRALRRMEEIDFVVDGPHPDEADPEEEIKVGGEIVFDSPAFVEEMNQFTLPYQPDAGFLGEMDYAISYIEPEEYYDEDDGYAKEQISILIGSDNVTLFMQDGEIIEDWREKIGDTILVDFHRLVPPGQERVLYVRNQKRNEDFEVLQELA